MTRVQIIREDTRKCFEENINIALQQLEEAGCTPKKIKIWRDGAYYYGYIIIEFQ